MTGERTRHQGDLEPDEEYDGFLFADASFTSTAVAD